MTRLTRYLLVAIILSSGLALPAPALAAARTPIVTAQGVVNFTGDPIDWRVYELEADPDNPRQAVTAAAGFTYVDSGGLIVLDANSGREALLGAGEAAFSNDGDQLVINTEAAVPVSYRRIVLMPDDFTDDESNHAVYESDAFTILSGKREVELAVGNLAGDDDTISIAASENGLGLIMALDADITLAGTGEPFELASGEYAALSEDIDITALDPASFAVVRIGPTVRDVSQPLPLDEGTSDIPVDDDVPVDDGGEVDPPADGTGTLTLQPQICGMGGSTGGCSNRPDAAYLRISGGGLGAPVVTSEIAANDDGTYTLIDLPYGDYVIENLDSAKGDYETEGGWSDPGSPNVFVVTISADNPDPVFSVRLLPPSGIGTITLELYVCPEGLPGAWAQPWFCAVQFDGWELSLTSDAFAGTLRTSDAPSTGTGYVFTGLAVDYAYRLSIDAYPTDYPLVWVYPENPTEGPIRVDLANDYSVQTFRFYAVTTDSADLSGVDSDGDLLSDDFELNVIGTSPALVDSDGDSVWDSRELETGTNPLDPESYWFG